MSEIWPSSRVIRLTTPTAANASSTVVRRPVPARNSTKLPLSRQLRQPDANAPREPVLLADDRDQRLALDQHLPLQALASPPRGRPGALGDERQIERPRSHTVHQLGARPTDRCQLDPRVLAIENPEQRDHVEHPPAVWVAPTASSPRSSPANASSSTRASADGHQDSARIADQQLARRRRSGRCDWCAQTTHIEFRLQTLDLMAQRRLHHVTRSAARVKLKQSATATTY